MSERVKICHLTSGHSPTDTRIFLKECRSLARSGYDVSYVVPGSDGALVDGVQRRNVTPARRRLERMTKTVWGVFRAALRENARVYHVHDPELIPIGVLLKLRGKRMIYDAHEDLPRQIYNKPYIPRWLQRAVSCLASGVVAVGTAVADGIVTATPAIARTFPASKTVVVQNYPILGELMTAEPRPFVERPPCIGYVGGMTAVRGIRELVQAMSLLPDALNARLVLAGSFGPAALEGEVRQLPGWDRVEHRGMISREQVRQLLSEVYAGVVTFYPVPNHTDAQPNKLFEYMSAGVPVIASDFPLWRQWIEADGCGLLVDPRDPAAIAEAIRWMLEHPEEAEAMGKRGQQAVFSRYNWESESKTLVELYQRIAL